MKMVSLRAPKSDGDTQQPAMAESPENEGVAVHLDHHHLTKLGLGGSLKSGDDVEFNGRGKVERSETRTDKDGERHSATLRFHKGSVEHEGDIDDPRAGLKGEIVKNVEKAELVK